jgi:hypothetical protein
MPAGGKCSSAPHRALHLSASPPGRFSELDVYLHVRVLFSTILGLGASHLRRRVARIVQHPKEYKMYWVHLVWSLFLFLYLLHSGGGNSGCRRLLRGTFPR